MRSGGALLALAMLAAATVSADPADPEADARRRLLDLCLSASTPRDASEALLAHGAIRDEELPYLAGATSAFFTSKRHNAADLLHLGKPEKADPFAEKVVLGTSDVYVWAVLADGLLERRPALAARRPEMIRKGLDRLDPQARVPTPRPGEKPRPVSPEDQRVIRTALRAAALSRWPGLDEVLARALGNPEGRVRAVALDGLSRESARALAPTLAGMLATERDVWAFDALGLALVRTGDPAAWAALDAGLAAVGREARGSHRSGFRNALLVEGENDPAREDFLWWAIREKRAFGGEALDLLTTAVWTGQAKPDRRLVEACAAVIRSGNPSTDVFRYRTSEVSKEQESCELLVSFLANGTNPIGDFEHRKRGSDAVAAARQWLAKEARRE